MNVTLLGKGTGEGSGTPLQYSCLENPMDGGAWWAAWGREELDTTERLHFHFSLSCIGEGNGNPLQCSCLENPSDRGAWWAGVYGIAQSRTRLKRLSSSSSNTTWEARLCIHWLYCLVSLICLYLWRRQWQPTPVFLPGKSHGRRSLVGCSPRGR